VCNFASVEEGEAAAAAAAAGGEGGQQQAAQPAAQPKPRPKSGYYVGGSRCNHQYMFLRK
jgi:hypothetical protein